MEDEEVEKRWRENGEIAIEEEKEDQEEVGE